MKKSLAKEKEVPFRNYQEQRHRRWLGHRCPGAWRELGQGRPGQVRSGKVAELGT